MLTSCVVVPSDESMLEPAQELAERLHLTLASPDSVATEFFLLRTPKRLELHKSAEKTKGLYVDFSDLGFRQGKDPILKAMGLKANYKPRVIDCTAGLGQDAFVLAAQGCQVSLLERSSLVHALLEDGLARAFLDSRLKDIAQRMTLHHQEALEHLANLKVLPDVVYLDPMYPESGKLAAKRKSMRFFRELLGDDLDAESVLTKALSLDLKRVVVKRPIKALPLASIRPQGSLKGKTTRFDIYT